MGAVDVNLGRNILLCAVGVLWVAGAVWFSTGWIDDGDNTCGSVWHPEIWRDRAWVPCGRAMVVRTAVSVGGAVAGVGMFAAGFGAYVRSRRAIDWTIGVAAGALVVTLGINAEVVR